MRRDNGYPKRVGSAFKAMAHKSIKKSLGDRSPDYLSPNETALEGTAPLARDEF